jgi:pyridoxal 5'-phosphate synthase pdxT subunit
MVKKTISIGVVGVQGAVSEHIAMMKKVFEIEQIDGSVYSFKQKEMIKDLKGIILPGGESTTISRFLQRHGLTDEIRKRVSEGSLALMGTCAGCVLLAKQIVDDDADVSLLKVMDIEVKRNAFGRQRESFEKDVFIKDWKKPFPAVFIRAPVIKKTGTDCRVLSQLESNIIMVEQKNMLAVSFHPELSEDPRIHHYFLQKTVSL